MIYTDIRALRFFEPLLYVAGSGSSSLDPYLAKHLLRNTFLLVASTKQRFNPKAKWAKFFRTTPHPPPPPRARAIMSRWQMTRAVDMWCPTPTGCPFGCHVVLGSMEEAVIPAAHLLQHAPPSRMKPKATYHQNMQRTDERKTIRA